MFESNYPADKQSFSYNVIWNAYKRVARALELTAEQTARCAAARRRGCIGWGSCPHGAAPMRSYEEASHASSLWGVITRSLC